MLSAEMQHSAKAFIVKLEGGLGAKFLAAEAYVSDVCKRLDRRESLPASLISV